MRLPTSMIASLVLAACGRSPARAPLPPPTTAPTPAAAPHDRPGCDGARLPLPPDDADLTARVGVRTLTAGDLTIEAWYPARAMAPRATRYDLRAQMPPAAAAAIPDEAEPWLTCPCTRDAALDDAGGPYPVVIFLHGAASFRAQSAGLAARWAARGFVVLAPDLPGVGLRAALGEGGGLPFATPPAVLDLALAPPAADDPLAFVRPHLGARVAVVGHSLGAMLTNGLADRPEVALTIGLAPGLVAADGQPRLLVAGDRDAIVPVDRLRDLHGERTGAALAIVPGADHLTFTDLCQAGARHGGPLAAARAFGVDVPPALVGLVGDACAPDADDPRQQTAIAALTGAALDRALACTDDTAAATAAAHGLVFLPARAASP